jgi:Ca2+-binding EF-hand superfamily protein
MLVDRSDDGQISAEELVAWSQTEGEYVSPEDAQRVLEAVDGDKDGSIGLEDWLFFGACCKEAWLEELENEELETLAGL